MAALQKVFGRTIYFVNKVGINRLEMMAVFRTLKPFLPDLRGHHLL